MAFRTTRNPDRQDTYRVHELGRVPESGGSMHKTEETLNELAISTVEVFAGVGMLGEGLRAGLGHLGVSHRTVCYVEREAYAASVLAARMQEGSLDDAPIWSDVCTFPARRFLGRVDGIVAGFPCQDISIAGRRDGLDGDRSGLFFKLPEIADACGAWFMFLENVSAIATATAATMDEASASEYATKPNGDGFSGVGIENGRLLERAAARVVGELADRRWNAEWITISASDVGASHGRARWFCLAWRDLANSQYDSECTKQRPKSWERCNQSSAQESKHWLDGANVDDSQRPERRPPRSSGTGCEQGYDDGRTQAHSRLRVTKQALGDAGLQHGELQQREVRAEHSRTIIKLDNAGSIRRRFKPMADADGSGSTRIGGNKQDGIAECSNTLADTSSSRLQVGSWECEDIGALQQTERPESGGIRDALELFAPGPNDPRWSAIIGQYPECAPALEPTFRKLVNGLAFDMDDSRAARLKCVGNGVVPLQAAVAFVVLARRSGIFT